MPRRSSLTARTLAAHGFKVVGQGGNLSAAVASPGHPYEYRIYDGTVADAMAPTHLNRPVYLQVVDLTIEERDGCDFSAKEGERYYSTLAACLDAIALPVKAGA